MSFTPSPPQQGNTDLANPTSGNVLGVNADGSLPIEGGITPGDAVAFAGELPAVLEEQSGTGVTSAVRLITKFIPLQAVALTHGTPVDVYTPTTGKKWRLLGYHISATVASAIQFEDGTGNEVLRTPLLVAATPTGSGNMGNGILSGAANTHMFLDCTVTTNVSGWIGIEEE